ncbi:MAG: hypothetical protein AABW99_02735 [archaeon]
MESPFRLMVMAIAAAAFLYILLSYFMFPQAEAIPAIQKALDYAEQNGGKSHGIQLEIPSGVSFSGKTFDTRTRSVRFECNSPDTCGSGAMEITARGFSAKQRFFGNAHFRCVRKETINDCVIYFGEKPAQLEIIGFEAKESIGGTQKTLELDVQNTGSLNSIGGFYAAKIYRVTTEGMEEQRNLVRDFGSALNNLGPGEAQKIAIQFEVAAGARYAATATVSGEDSGEDSAEKGFETSGNFNPACKAVAKREQYEQAGSCITEYSCEGCNAGYECKAAWEQKGTIGITSFYPDKAIVSTEKTGGSCT